MRAQQDAGPSRIGGERIEGRKLMVQPRPGKSNPQHQRRVDPGQRLVEIRALLLGDPVTPL
tara:strand:- start:93 stop:275 length:183 start_codon:yes stop_codon:yes gene_type:complete